MNRINNFFSWINVIITAIISVLTTYFVKGLELLDSYNEIDEKSILIAISLIVIIVLSKSFEGLVRKLVANSVVLRKVIMGNQFVEGYWIDATYDFKIDAKGPTSFAVIKLSFDKNILISSGEGFNKDFSPKGFWRTYISTYQDFKLRYAYEGLNIVGESIDNHGYGQYNFFEGSSTPFRFAGFIHYVSKEKKLILRGIKIRDKELLKNIDDQEGRIAAIKKYMREFTSPISSDEAFQMSSTSNDL